jgi:DNA adenine methylase
MPPHLHYVEAYAGGLQVLFARDPHDPRLFWPGLTSDGRKPDGVSELANDIHGDLLNLYRVLRDPNLFEQFRGRLELTTFSELEWRLARETLHANAGSDAPSVERAACMFVYCRQSRQGLMKDFATPVRTRLRGRRNDGVNAWWSAVEGLEGVHRRLADVMFVCRPALEVIRSEDTEATLFYLDPPYVEATRTAKECYRYEMSDADHRALLDLLLAVKGKVMLSGYANEMYDRTLSSWIRHDFPKANSAGSGPKKQQRTESVWTNF